MRIRKSYHTRLIPCALFLIGLLAACASTEHMPTTNISNVVTVVPVENHREAVGWYTNLLGREADLVPAEGVAEWQLADNAWLQVGIDPERAGNTTVIIGVHDLDAQRSSSEEAGVPLGEVFEIPGIIRLAETVDPEGNKVVFVQDISGEA